MHKTALQRAVLTPLSSFPVSRTEWAIARIPHLFDIRTGVNASDGQHGRSFLAKWLVRNDLAEERRLDRLLRRVSLVNAQRIVVSLLAMTLLGTLPVYAASTSTNVQVSVQVIARAIVSIDSQPASVTVTDADIARGYVDVTAPIVVRVRTNSRRGYVLQVENQSETFSSVELTSGEVQMSVANHEAFLQRPYIAGGDLIPMHARLHLSQVATAGSFSLPVAFTASAL